ncbi:MAG: limonene-1,2-epoxide hydrolase family protein [Alphaproteobacteria bacterium]|nr:limonene-1,2-epoxide hydrolase family protein [Alphaproteobacteria bacterium]
MSNTAIVKDFIAAWEAQDLDRVMGFFTDDAVYHNIPMPVLNGVADIRKTIAGFIGMGEKLVFETHHIAEASGGVVMTERTDKFLMNGQWLELPVMGVFEIKDGKIAKWRDYFDLGQFQTQVAAISSQKVAE